MNVEAKDMTAHDSRFYKRVFINILIVKTFSSFVVSNSWLQMQIPSAAAAAAAVFQPHIFPCGHHPTCEPSPTETVMWKQTEQGKPPQTSKAGSALGNPPK